MTKCKYCDKEAITLIIFEEHKGGSGHWFSYVCKKHLEKYIALPYARENKEWFEKLEKIEGEINETTTMGNKT